MMYRYLNLLSYIKLILIFFSVCYMLILIMFIHQLDWKERESNRSHAGPEWDPFSARE